MSSSKSSPKSAFNKLVQNMKRSDRSDNDSTNRIPSCLRESLEDVESGSCKSKTAIPCLICGRLFRTVYDIIDHSYCHTKNNSVCFECCFCGMSFDSEISLSLHQMSAPTVVDSCRKCRKNFHAEKEMDQHLCPKRRVTSSERSFISFSDDQNREKLLVCPLGCSAKRRKFSGLKNLLDHLRCLHGCQPKDVRVCLTSEGDQISIEELDFFKTCEVCRISVNTLNIPLHQHLLYQCQGRGPMAQEHVRQLEKFAQENKLDRDLVVRMEIESFWLDLETQVKARALGSNLEEEDQLHLDKSQAQNQKYSSKWLPENFYPNFLAFVPFGIPVTLEMLRSKNSDLVFMFRIWCQCIERAYSVGQEQGQGHFRFEMMSADLYSMVADALPPLAEATVDAFSKCAPISSENVISEPLSIPDLATVKRMAKELEISLSDLEESCQAESEEDENEIIVLKRKKKIRRKKLEGFPKVDLRFVSDRDVDQIRDLKILSQHSLSSDKEVVSPRKKRKTKLSWKVRELVRAKRIDRDPSSSESNFGD